MTDKRDGDANPKKARLADWKDSLATKKLFRNQSFVLFGALALLVALCIGVAIYALRDLRISNYKTNAHSVNVVMSNLSKNLDLTFDAKWDNVHWAAVHIKKHTPDSLSELAKLLADMREETAGEDINYYMLDDLGNAYYSDGLVTHWKYALAVKASEESLLLIEPEFGVSTENRMVYIVPLKSPLVVGASKLTHMVFSEPVNAFEKYFDTTSYGENSLSFIITKDGRFIYENGIGTSISRSYNLLKFISNDNNVKFQFGESYAAFHEAFNSAVRNETYLVTYNGRNYYLSFFPLKMQDWYSIMLVPEVSVEDDNRSFSNKMALDIFLLFLAVLSLFVVFFILMWRHTMVQQRLATEAERRANNAKTDFLSSMSHDIRTPMNAILGMTQIAMYNYNKPELVKQNLTKIKTSSIHLLTLINDILDINKIESGKMPINIAEYSVKHSIETISNIIKPLAEEKKIEFNITTKLQQDKLWGDVLRINQICLNLLTNAVKYTQAGGRVDLEVYHEDVPDNPEMLTCIIIVRDNGMGISEDFQKVMYNTFSRGTDSRVSKITGSGLGLAICRQLITRMNGDIDCVSHIGEGTQFTITLALKRGKPDDYAADAKDASLGQSPTVDVENADLNGMRVLVAEDNDMNWDVLNTILEMYGVDAERAENGQVVLDMLSSAEEGRYKAVLMDVRMPVMDGREATCRIRAHQKQWIQTIPVVAMTADAFAEDIQACLDVGMDAHLSKPISTQTLFNTLVRICRDRPFREYDL